ncbi:MAG: MlaD family protein [Candidatus Poribacteria bacterium]|nr:MlaD family protein [Candidatus Poribacteria bacterium]MDE0502550.1 MlaD family protein [Candidatus Poribacteria bacterium]
MDSWTTHAKVGIVVIVGLVLLGVLLVMATDWPFAASGDHLIVHFKRVNDLQRGAGVYLSGVAIGKVTAIDLKANEDIVEIRMRVKNAFQRIRQGCTVKIGIFGFVGEAYIDIVNGPVDSPLLNPSDLPLTGQSPLGLQDFLQQSNQAILETIQLTRSANELIQLNRENIQQGIADVRQLVAQTGEAVERASKNTQETVEIVKRLANENDKRFEQTLGRVNQLLEQLTGDSQLLGERIDAITSSVLDLVDRNSDSINQIVTDLNAGSSDFRQLSQQLRKDLGELNAELSDLVAESREVIESDAPKLNQILADIAELTAELEEFPENLNHILEQVRHGDGSLAQLLNKPDTINEVRETLKTINDTVGEIYSFSGKVDRRFGDLKAPELAWDYELRYLSLEESLHNEFALVLLPSLTQRLRFGFGMRNKDVKFESQYAQDFFDGRLRGRVGFMRSRAGVGIDAWLFARRLGLTVEGFHLTSKNPELNAEMAWRFFRYGHVILGAENLTDDIRYTAGIRLVGSNW